MWSRYKIGNWNQPSLWQNGLFRDDRREHILTVVSSAHVYNNYKVILLFFSFQSLPLWHRIETYKLTGDPANPTSPGFPFLPGSPFKGNKQKNKPENKVRGSKED